MQERLRTPGAKMLRLERMRAEVCGMAGSCLSKALWRREPFFYSGEASGQR